MGFECMEKEKLPCGKSKMIGSHPPIVSTSHYNSLLSTYALSAASSLLIKAIRRRVEGPRTMPHDEDLKFASQVRRVRHRLFIFIYLYLLPIYQSIARTLMVAEGFHVEEKRQRSCDCVSYSIGPVH